MKNLMRRSIHQITPIARNNRTHSSLSLFILNDAHLNVIRFFFQLVSNYTNATHIAPSPVFPQLKITIHHATDNQKFIQNVNWNCGANENSIVSFVINCLFSELPDNDANTQVLLLGVTRLDTPLRSSPPTFVKPKRPYTYHGTTTIASDAAHPHKTTLVAADDTDVTITKTVTNRKFDSSYYLTDHQSSIANAVWINRVAPKNKSTTFLSTKSKRNLNTFLGRFNRNSGEKEIIAEDGNVTTARHINRSPAVETNECQNDQQPSVNVHRGNTQPTLSSVRVKKSKTARLTSCIPYCANKHESSEAPTDSLVSSFRIVECCAPITSNHGDRTKTNTNCQRREQHQRQNLITQLNRLRSSNELIPSNLRRLSIKSTHQNRNSSNNNSSLFNNLNIMDRSVDSIGSCSLDVDAESTDFSGSTHAYAPHIYNHNTD